MNITFKLNYQDLSIIRKQLFFYKLLTKYIDKARHVEADYFSVSAKLINKSTLIPLANHLLYLFKQTGVQLMKMNTL